MPLQFKHLIAEGSGGSGGVIVEREINSTDISYARIGGGGGGGGNNKYNMMITVPELTDATKRVVAVIVDFALAYDAPTLPYHKETLIYTTNHKTLYSFHQSSSYVDDLSSYITTSGNVITASILLGALKTSYPVTVYKAIVIYEDLGA